MRVDPKTLGGEKVPLGSFVCPDGPHCTDWHCRGDHRIQGGGEDIRNDTLEAIATDALRKAGMVVSSIGSVAHVPKPYFLCLREGRKFIRMHKAPLLLADLETHPIHRELTPSEIHLMPEKESQNP